MFEEKVFPITLTLGDTLEGHIENFIRYSFSPHPPFSLPGSP